MVFTVEFLSLSNIEDGINWLPSPSVTWYEKSLKSSLYFSILNGPAI